ncbi:hypothetical protein C9975_03720 [Thalassospira xiamenensis]|nr:hypothetical protein C9975_03720 [Thalassospira xiamenensis]
MMSDNSKNQAKAKAEQTQPIQLDQNAWKKLTAANENPPKPTPELVDLMKSS